MPSTLMTFTRWACCGSTLGTMTSMLSRLRMPTFDCSLSPCDSTHDLGKLTIKLAPPVFWSFRISTSWIIPILIYIYCLFACYRHVLRNIYLLKKIPRDCFAIASNYLLIVKMGKIQARLHDFNHGRAAL